MASILSGAGDHEKKKISSCKKASWKSGETVMVRVNHYKWLQGQVKRLARGGVAVWVAEAKLVVHVPLQLAASHLSTSSSSPTSTSSASILRISTGQPDRCLLLAVRPSHLSHRPLFQRLTKLAPPIIDIHVPFQRESTPPSPPAAPPSLAVAEQNHHCSENHPASRCSLERDQVDRFSAPPAGRAASHVNDLVSFPEQEHHAVAAVIGQALANHQSTPADAEVIHESEPVSAPGNRPSSQTGPIPIGDQSSYHATASGMHAESTPEKTHFLDSPPLSPASSLTSQRALKLLESIPESSDCSPACGELATLKEMVKTSSGRFSRPHLEVPHNDICTSSSSSSTATTPSPGRQTLADRIKKFKLPASEKTSPSSSSQPEKQRSASQPESLHGSWITIIQDGTHEKSQRFLTT